LSRFCRAVEPDTAVKVLDIADEHGLRDKSAGLGLYLKNLISKIPGLPKPEEAQATLIKFLKEKGEASFKRMIEGIATGLEQPSGIKEASIQDVFLNLRGLADPKILLAALTMFMSAGTTEAGPILDLLKARAKQQEQAQPQTQQAQQTKAPEWVNLFEKADKGPQKDARFGTGAIINFQGKSYRVGQGENKDYQKARSLAENAARMVTPGGKGTGKDVQDRSGIEALERSVKTLPDSSYQVTVLMNVGN